LENAVETSRPTVENIVVDAANNRVSVAVNPAVYPLDVIYGAGFIYVDRAFVILDRIDPDHVLVTLTARRASDEQALRDLGGAFANELLTQALRETIARKTQKIRELVINRALYSTLDSGGGGGEMDFEEEDDLEFLDDPLGIAVPWEEKFEGEGEAVPAAAEPAAAEPSAEEPSAEEPSAEEPSPETGNEKGDA
jgi:His-Xaa-Ser system protein HxsD